MTRKVDFAPYKGPAGGWGSAYSVGNVLVRQMAPGAVATLGRQNKAGGHMCTSCAWAKPARSHPFEFCENGAKATAWETTTRRADSGFFATHSVSELRAMTDFELENAGRLTTPMRWDPLKDAYVEVDWEQAFAEIGAELTALRARAEQVVFYTSGRASLETSYMYQLFARVYGNNNLPDSSNMCHESTSVALPKTIGVPVGTVRLPDFAVTDAIFFFGQNVGTSSPRLLHELQQASERGVPIVTFNPLRERGLEAFKNPQSPSEMVSSLSTRISSQYHQVVPGGDCAAIAGMCKAILQADDEAVQSGAPRVLDIDFIREHTDGFDAFAQAVRAREWADIERESGLTRGALQAAARVYCHARAAIAIYGMGMTQHVRGVDNVHMITNLLLMRGNIGKPGAGVCPVRGHSNVQGQRTVGITEKPELAPLDRLAELYGFTPPRAKGLDTVGTCEGVMDGSVRGFVGLGGNLLRAAPDSGRLEPAWRGLRLTVHIATKLNRTHLHPGEIGYLLPCLARSELHASPRGAQAVSTEDSTACIHGSMGRRKPASARLLAESAIVAAIAERTVAADAAVPWPVWAHDMVAVRAAMAATWPDQFGDIETAMWQPGGMPRPLGARQREWKTGNGRANFMAEAAVPSESASPGSDVLRLMTLRSNDQFNTTVYGYDDRFRGIKGTRHVVLMHRNDIDRLGLYEGDTVKLCTVAADERRRELEGLRVVPYDVPEGSCASYFPECNVLLPLGHHARESRVPAAKSIPVRIVRLGGVPRATAPGKAGASRVDARHL
ncbi:FdhF/YdeP family oxidoreductase [Verticiella sediminum]|uniref:FdhF/YdeP family oxidoreductase n=1 Tax=Verticiella sediminum TaxID=1247510 RepID=A0A556B057_9BURK|nr:FdhF/YdeP family oxidoreductase [Verticiella sediminum]TSH98559.1 FdhF/YdeP family oxidoreductase [Verticiella sediminum]